MALNRIPCPECGAGLKSPSGFAIGQTVCCPKCETYFVVEEPAEDNEATEETNKLKKAKTQPTKATAGGKKPVKAMTLPDDDDDEEDDEEDDRPKKKKKKKRQDDDEEESQGSYKNSPLRFAVLGVLIVTALVLAYFLYDKRMKQRADNEETASTDSGNSTPPAPPMPPGGQKGPNFGGPGGPGGFRPGGPAGFGPQPGGPGGFGPGGPGGFGPGGQKLPNNPGAPGGPGVPGGLFGPDTLTDAEKTKLTEKYKSQLIGTWKADLGDVTAQLVYTADGKLTETITGPMGTKTRTGTWAATGASRKGLLVTFRGMPERTKPVELIFEDDELQHPVLDPVLGIAVIGIFRKA